MWLRGGPGISYAAAAAGLGPPCLCLTPPPPPLGLQVSGGDDGVAKLWDLRQKRSVRSFTEPYQILAVEFAEAGDQVCVCVWWWCVCGGWGGGQAASVPSRRQSLETAACMQAGCCSHQELRELVVLDVDWHLRMVDDHKVGNNRGPAERGRGAAVAAAAAAAATDCRHHSLPSYL